MGDRLQGGPHIMVGAAGRPRYVVVAVVAELVAGDYLFREDRGISEVLDSVKQMAAGGHFFCNPVPGFPFSVLLFRRVLFRLFPSHALLSPLPNPFPFELRNQCFLRARAFHRVAGPTKQLQVVQMVRAALRLWNDMVNRKVPKLKVVETAFTNPSCRPKRVCL